MYVPGLALKLGYRPSSIWSGWSGLLHYWSLDEASGNRADIVGSADLTDNGTVDSDTGMYSLAASFSGSNYLDLHSDSTLDLNGGSFTIAGWFKPSTVANTLISRSPHDTPAPQYAIYFGTNYVGFAIFNWSPYHADSASTSAGSVTKDNWYHFVAWKNGTTNVNIKLNNGTTVTGDISITPDAGDATFFLGARCADMACYAGLLDEVGIWNRVLTTDEMTDLYSSGAGKFYPN